MTLLLRATEVIGLPVVTIAGGDDIAEVKDVVYRVDQARLVGFTLNRRGFLAGPMNEALPWSAVAALGRDAVMVADETALAKGPEARDITGGGTRDVIGAEVLTDDGDRLGEVLDVVLHVDDAAEVVGYEIESPDRDRSMFVPLPDTLAVSEEALLVPAAVRDFLSDDLAGFGGSVESFRAHLRSTS
ncbi:MAG TPA: PRC-barrel domain-containing protein [Acidimicrobiales bacterium]|nr:PRC-barrel domain-containing protein [Acidimicrobiales bacterium]